MVHRENMEKEREEAEAMDLLAQAADECARQDQEEEEKNDDEVCIIVTLPKQRYGGAHKRHWPLPVRVHAPIISYLLHEEVLENFLSRWEVMSGRCADTTWCV